jgi:acetyl-CoA carboxylase biotin carboxylase subunit
VRVDTHVEEGYTIPPFYDSLIAKVIVWGEDREVALSRGRRALTELELDGVPTTKDLALDIVSSEEFASGDYSTSFLVDAAASLVALRGGAA